MGLSLGGSSSSSKSQTNTSNTSSSNGTQANTYSAPQTSLQDQLVSTLSSLITGPTSPAVTAQQTQSADQINSEYSSMGQRMTNFLAARGFGNSGQTGQAEVQTEIGRQGALANNTANYGAEGLNLFQSSLTDALSAAFKNIGSTTANTGSSTGQSITTGSQSGTNWGASAGIGSSGYLQAVGAQ